MGELDDLVWGRKRQICDPCQVLWNSTEPCWFCDGLGVGYGKYLKQKKEAK